MPAGNDSVLHSDSSRLKLPRSKRWYLLIAFIIAVIIISRACAPAPIARTAASEPNSSSADAIARFGTDLNRNLSDQKPPPAPVVSKPTEDPEYQAWLRSKDDQSRADREAKAEEARKLRDEALHSVSVISPAQSQASDLKPAADRTEQQTQQLPPTPNNTEPAATTEKSQDTASPFASQDKWDGPLHYLVRGTLIPCTVVNQVNGSAAGPIQCIVSRDIYSQNSAHVLIPKGSNLNGEVGKVSSVNQERLYASFNDLIMPDLFEYTMKDQVVLSQEGEVGLREKVDRHIAQIFGTSLALAAIAGLAQIGNTNSYASPFGQYRVGVTENLSESSMAILQQKFNVLPSFILKPGARSILILSNTISLPDYSMHRVPADL